MKMYQIRGTLTGHKTITNVTLGEKMGHEGTQNLNKFIIIIIFGT